MIGLENNPQGKISLTATLYSKENGNLFALSTVGRTMKKQDSETPEQVYQQKVAEDRRKQTR